MKISEILSSPDKWTKEHCAKDSDGDPTNSSSPTAVCWCLAGAMNRMISLNEDMFFSKTHFTLTEIVRSTTKHQEISYFNDAPETTYEDVMKVVKLFEGK